LAVVGAATLGGSVSFDATIFTAPVNDDARLQLSASL
jgi:hypothetical protein